MHKLTKTVDGTNKYYSTLIHIDGLVVPITLRNEKEISIEDVDVGLVKIKPEGDFIRRFKAFFGCEYKNYVLFLGVLKSADGKKPQIFINVVEDQK